MADLALDMVAGLASLSLPLLLFVTVVVPTLVLAFAGRVVRMAFAVTGLATFFGISYAVDLGGPDSVLLMLPLLGLMMAFDAAAAEVGRAVFMNVTASRADSTDGRRNQ